MRRLASLVMSSSLALAACGSSSTSDDQPDAAASAELDVNDVSILFPLPANDSQRASELWLVPHAGEQGPYFPIDRAGELGALNGDLPGSAGYPAAMVTALRFDPCFPRLGGASCQAQLRLIAQPVFPSATGVSMVDDAAVHLFYALSATEADAVLGELVAIRAQSPVATAGPLGVHPGLAADLAGPTGAAVRALVVAHARADNLVRITTNAFAMDNWAFRRFDRDASGTLAHVALAGLVTADSVQAWLRQAERDSTEDPTGTITPAPADGFTYLLDKASFTGSAPVDPARAAAAAERLLAIENPERTLADDTDCASCHLATQARLFAQRHGVAFEAATKFRAPAGVSDELVLAPELDGNLGATIAFGYHTRTLAQTPVPVPSISQRTVNESAAIAAFLAGR